MKKQEYPFYHPCYVPPVRVRVGMNRVIIRTKCK